MADDLEAGGNVLQHLGDIFAELGERAATLRADLLCGRVRFDLPRKMLREWASRWLGSRSWSVCCRGDNRLALCAIGFELFQLQLKLLNLALNLL